MKSKDGHPTLETTSQPIKPMSTPKPVVTPQSQKTADSLDASEPEFVIPQEMKSSDPPEIVVISTDDDYGKDDSHYVEDDV